MAAAQNGGLERQRALSASRPVASAPCPTPHALPHSNRPPGKGARRGHHSVLSAGHFRTKARPPTKQCPPSPPDVGARGRHNDVLVRAAAAEGPLRLAALQRGRGAYGAVPEWSVGWGRMGWGGSTASAMRGIMEAPVCTMQLCSCASLARHAMRAAHVIVRATPPKSFAHLVAVHVCLACHLARRPDDHTGVGQSLDALCTQFSFGDVHGS